MEAHPTDMLLRVEISRIIHLTTMNFKFHKSKFVQMNFVAITEVFLNYFRTGNIDFTDNLNNVQFNFKSRRLSGHMEYWLVEK